jgi:tripartite-type tricarboxylate transporter receptor subunit TctC
LRDKLSVEAVEPMVMGPDEFAQFIKTDIARWTKLAKERNIQLDS